MIKILIMILLIGNPQNSIGNHLGPYSMPMPCSSSPWKLQWSIFQDVKTAAGRADLPRPKQVKQAPVPKTRFSSDLTAEYPQHRLVLSWVFGFTARLIKPWDVGRSRHTLAPKADRRVAKKEKTRLLELCRECCSRKTKVWW